MASDPHEEKQRLAEAIRAACMKAAMDAYEDASMRGVCHEGAWECAVGAIRSLEVETIVAMGERSDDDGDDT